MRNDEGTGGVVWVCEHGCVDLLHRREGNYLDICATCGKGQCEPRATLGRRSKAQRAQDRELAESFPRFAESLKRPRPAPKRKPAEVKVTRPGQSEVVPAEEFERPALVPPFNLTPDQRRAILDPDRKAPRIAFSRTPPIDHPKGQPWPASKGDIVQVSQHVKIVVLGLSTKEAEVEVQYEIRDDRRNLPEPVKAHKPLDPKTPPTTMYRPERGESEPEPPSRAEASQLADQVHEAELRKLRGVRKQHGEHLAELASQPRDVRWSIKKTIEKLDARIREIEHQLRNSRHRKQVEERRSAA